MKLGYWGPQTATIDWCEDNYEITNYIAEFWNTVSNLLMIVFPVAFLVVSRKQKIDVELRLCFLSLIVVGIGSWAFHMTLLYPMQLLDELPMIWCTCIMLYAMLKIEGQLTRWKTLSLVMYSIIFTLTYLWIPTPIIHHSSYAVLVAITFCKTMISLRNKNCSSSIAIISSCTYIFGFLLWNVDNMFCGHLKSVRSTGLQLFSPLTQMHAWWHLFSGFGSYFFLILLTHMSMNLKEQRPGCLYTCLIIPVVRPQPKVKCGC